jgi:hypothetical protein
MNVDLAANVDLVSSVDLTQGRLRRVCHDALAGTGRRELWTELSTPSPSPLLAVEVTAK